MDLSSEGLSMPVLVKDDALSFTLKSFDFILKYVLYASPVMLEAILTGNPVIRIKEDKIRLGTGNQCRPEPRVPCFLLGYSFCRAEAWGQRIGHKLSIEHCMGKDH